MPHHKAVGELLHVGAQRARVATAVVEGAEAEEVARAAVVRLRMLDDVSDAASLWSAFKSGTTPASSLGDRRADAASGNASRAAAQAARSLRAAWRKRIGTLASAGGAGASDGPAVCNPWAPP